MEMPTVCREKVSYFLWKTKMKHKHCELIKAWADGAVIEHRCLTAANYNHWHEFDGCWEGEDWEYRIKPEPKPDVVEYWESTLTFLGQCEDIKEANLRLTFDGETGELKSAEVLK